MRITHIVGIIAVLFLSTSAVGQGTKSDYERAARLSSLTRDKVFRTRVEPHWFDGNDRFWYRMRLADRQYEFVLVDAVKGKRQAAFDHKRLARSLGKATKRSVDAKNLPFTSISFSTGRKTVRFSAHGRKWWCDLKTYAVALAKREAVLTRKPTARRPRGRTRRRSGSSSRSPDGKWSVAIRNHDVYLRDQESKKEHRLSHDGTRDYPYDSRFYWSPNSQRLVVLRTKRGDERRVQFVESSPRNQLQPKVHSHHYLKPGDKIPLTKPTLFNVISKKPISVKDRLFPNPWRIRDVRWAANSKRFTFAYNQRGHQVLRIIAVDASSGKTNAIVDETSKTFLDYANKRFSDYLDDTGELIWMSERDGWNHLYLYDYLTGKVKNQITKGPWVVRGVERVDEKARQIWFRASGIDAGQDPYYIHFCRINFDGTGLVRLTQGDGTHSMRFSPDRRFLIDTYSRVDMPIVTELRRVTDGKHVCKLEAADLSLLKKTGWKVPIRFTAKGRDGKTDIHGVIFQPTTFDPKIKYPIIEKIYAGPHGSFVPKRFGSFHSTQALAELGFIVVQIDGMGTSNRSKAFHDVAAKNIGDSGFPDRILWIKAAAKKYPYMDVTRVGIFGGSAGGQSSTRAMLAHPKFYKAAVSVCGCHDNRMDKIWWNELWMGWPIGPHYAEQSNVTNAHKLEGKLFLIVGELDRNVDPASTMQVVNALIKANKDFDLLVIPGGGHGIGGRYGIRRRRDFFVRHLHHVEPRSRQ